MEVSDIAQNLWKKYGLPWQNDAHLASEWYARTFVRGIINPHRRLEYIGEQGENKVTSLRYVERGYGVNGGFGGISVHDAPRAAGTGIYFEVAPSAHRDFTERLRRSGQTGAYLAGIEPHSQVEGVVLGGLVVTSLSIIEPFFVSFIEALPLSDHKQQGK